MEIKLPVYEKREVVKTYTAETYDIMFGTVEDLIGVLDLDKILSGNNKDLVEAVASAIPKVFNLIKPLLKDIFEGLTDDELKNCKVKDVAKALIAVVKYSLGQISEGSSSKN